PAAKLVEFNTARWSIPVEAPKNTSQESIQFVFGCDSSSPFIFRTSRAKRSVVIAQLSFFTGAGKPHREPHCIARKPNAWRLSGIREYCLGPRRRLGNAALRLYHTCAQHCSPMQRILRKVFLGSFGGTRACCLPSLVHRCTVL